MKCSVCGLESEPSVLIQSCIFCGGVLDLNCNTDVKKNQGVSLGEGNTPLVALRKIGARLGLTNLYAKLENLSPSGSFKDRGVSALISAAVEEGVTEFVEDSSGNAGASMAAYAAVVGLRMHLFLPDTTAKNKLRQSEAHGACVHPIKGPRQASTDAARKFVKEEGIPYLSHNLSPYFIEGMTSFGYELIEDLKGGVDHIVFPVGNGSLLLGTWLAYQRVTDQANVPKLHCIQAKAVAPIYRAIMEGQSPTSTNVEATIAAGIAVSQPLRGMQVVETVQSSGGSAVAVREDSIVEWRNLLAREEGIFCETTSAAAFAGLEVLVKQGIIGTDSSVVVPVTGSGLKDS